MGYFPNYNNLIEKKHILVCPNKLILSNKLGCIKWILLNNKAHKRIQTPGRTYSLRRHEPNDHMHE